MLLVATHPPDPRPALVIETTARIDAGAIDRLKQRMVGFGCPSGLLFDPDECLILRDTYSSLDADSLAEDGRVATDRLLARVRVRGGSLEQHVIDWLRSMAASWYTALPLENEMAAPFVTDIVPALSGSHLREVA